MNSNGANFCNRRVDAVLVIAQGATHGETQLPHSVRKPCSSRNWISRFAKGPTITTSWFRRNMPASGQN